MKKVCAFQANARVKEWLKIKLMGYDKISSIHIMSLPKDGWEPP